MKLIELQKYGNYSVILRQDNKGNPLVIEPFVVALYPRIEDGEVIDWSHGHYFDDLFNASNYARQKQQGLNYYRLEEIASKVIDGFVQNDKDSAYEYFVREVEIDDHEAKYFELDISLLDEYR